MSLTCPACEMANPADTATCLRCGRPFQLTVMADPDAESASALTVAAAGRRVVTQGPCQPQPLTVADPREAACATVTSAPHRRASDTPPPAAFDRSTGEGVPAGSANPTPATLRDVPASCGHTLSTRISGEYLPSDVTPKSKSSAAAALAGEVRLVVVRGERPGTEYSVLDGKNYVGRSADRPVDIDLDGQEPLERIWASRQHAVITREAGVVVIEDLNSLNGTFINRVRVHPGHPKVLNPGDVVQIGTVQLKVVV